MAINKKLISIATQAQFDAQLSAGNIDNRSIVFIEDKKRIWTHGVYFDTLWDYIQNKPSTLDEYGITDAAKKINSLYYVEGNTTGTAGAWTGSEPEITSLYAGLTIAYKVGVAGASTTNLNINSLGNILVRRNASNLTATHLPVGSVAILTYDGTYWVWADYNSTTNTYDRTYWNNTITAGAPIYRNKLLMQGLDGKFYPLTLETGTGTTKTVSTQEFEINSQILYYNTTATVAANGTTANVYSEIPITTLTYTTNQASWVSQQLVYLKGTILPNGNFKLDNTSYTSFMTQTLPTTADGFVYVLLGYMYSATAMRLFQFHPMYEYRDGALRTYMPMHSHGNITDGGAIGSAANKPIITGAGGVLQVGSFGTLANTFAEGNHTHSYLSDSPQDGKTYGRKDSSWTEISSGAEVYDYSWLYDIDETCTQQQYDELLAAVQTGKIFPQTIIVTLHAYSEENDPPVVEVSLIHGEPFSDVYIISWYVLPDLNVMVDQKDFGITKEEIENNLTGFITSHTHPYVGTSGNETVSGVKTFGSIPILPGSNPTTDNEAVRKKYVDDGSAVKLDSNKMQVVTELPAWLETGVFYFIKANDSYKITDIYHRSGTEDIRDGYWVHKNTGVITYFGLLDPSIAGRTMNSPSWRNDCSEVKLPSGVTHLGYNCFYNCTSLTSVTLPEGLTNLGSDCFYNCKSLTSITIPESVISIGNYCFRDCSSLTSINIPEGVTSLGAFCFDRCNSLSSVTLPEGVISLGLSCFNACRSLTSITIPESVTSIGGSCFSNCLTLALVTVLPAIPPSLGWGAFDGNASLNIKVYSSYVNAYKVATNWSAYAAKISAI